MANDDGDEEKVEDFLSEIALIWLQIVELALLGKLDRWGFEI